VLKNKRDTEELEGIAKREGGIQIGNRKKLASRSQEQEGNHLLERLEKRVLLSRKHSLCDEPGEERNGRGAKRCQCREGPRVSLLVRENRKGV